MKLNVILVIFSFLGIAALKAQKTYSLIPVEKSIVPDGMRDYNTNLLNRQENSPFNFALLKYDDHLFVILEVHDPKTQNQIIMTGLELEFTVKGKDGFQKSVRYPQGISVQDRPRDPNMLEAFEKAISIKREGIPAKMDQLELIGFYGKNDTIWGKNMNEGGINAIFGFDADGIMIYEADIPINTVFGQGNQSKSFKLKIETGKLGRPYLQGAPGVGISGTSLSNPSRVETRNQREAERKMEKYRNYTVPEEMELKKVFGLNVKATDN